MGTIKLTCQECGKTIEMPDTDFMGKPHGEGWSYCIKCEDCMIDMTVATNENYQPDESDEDVYREGGHCAKVLRIFGNKS